MADIDSVDEYIRSLKGYERLAPDIVYHKVIDEKEAEYAGTEAPFPSAIEKLLAELSIDRLYSHQAEALDLIREGQHTVSATPTASGKTLTYNLPVFEKIMEDPAARALYLFPLKALAQDQLKTVEKSFTHFTGEKKPTAAIYDGDTTPWFRSKIRRDPPNILLTNPEMLHLSMLPYHPSWKTFFENLSYVVVDEVHTYRGIMGSHMAWVFRRLLRICRHYGASPVFIFCSATIGNPGELAGALTGLTVKTVSGSGAPAARKHFIMINGLDGAAQTALLLLHAALHREFRTILYTQSRKMTELISMWAGQKAGAYRDRISAYRAGFLPEERREIEAKLSSGELLAVVSTSALELGIDIGKLDLCILVGYPGSVMASWQRAGRVGRQGRESAVVMIGHVDALDQYFMNNPEKFFEMAPETAMINPVNPVVMGRHLQCAAAELPVKDEELWLSDPAVKACVRDLEYKGTLLRSHEENELVATRKYPQREVNLRGTGRTVNILAGEEGENIGQIDWLRAFHETYPGAVYLHRGRSFVVAEFDQENEIVHAREANVNYFTRVRSSKTTEVLEVTGEKWTWGIRVCMGKLKVTELITGYEKKLVNGQKRIGIVPLNFPPLVFETEGVWLEIPARVQEMLEEEQKHFMGGIHALEHAMIGILPLLVLTDRNDLGGISIPFHEQLGTPAIFVYDGMPGGAGLSAQAFSRADQMLERTLEAMAGCPCETGCPACVHSPKCGSGNRPIDKAAAMRLLTLIREGAGHPAKGAGQANPSRRILPARPETSGEKAVAVHRPGRFAVLDLETQLSAQEVGGWHRAERMGISCVVVYDSREDDYRIFRDNEIDRLVRFLKEVDLVIGFNIRRFDYKVLSGYTRYNFGALSTLDMLDEVHKRLGYRLSLDHLAKESLGTAKSADGLTALKWWKEGRIDEIIDYCRQDVRVTRDLYLYGRKNGYLLFRNKAEKVVRIPVKW